jgi:hypothetical protein
LAGLDELLVISLDEPVTPDELLQQLNAAAPWGCRFTAAQQRPGKAPPQPRRIQMEMSIPGPIAGTLAARLAQLADMPQWPLQRESWKGALAGGRTAGQSAKGQTLDLKPMVQFELTGDKLNITMLSSGGQWARPSEVMRLLGLHERADLARICRTKIEYEYPCVPAPIADAATPDGCTANTITTAPDGCGTDNSQQESGLAPKEAAPGPTGKCENG